MILKKQLLVLFSTLLFLLTFSQTIGDFKDVLHLKNGETIEGVLIEQIPNQSVTILTDDNRELKFNIAEITKFTRKEILTVKENNIRWIDNFKRKNKSYFFDFDVLLSTIGGELRVTNGYKFGRFGKFGIATGFALLRLGDNNQVLPQFILNLVYSGDILDKRITPFYEVELGYSIPLGSKITSNYFNQIDHSNNITYPIKGLESTNYGGPKGAISFGVKMKTKKKIMYKIAIDYRASGNFFDSQAMSLFENGDRIKENSFIANQFSLIGGMGVRFGIGF